MLTPLRIAGFTRVPGAPENWNPDEQGPCIGLPIRDEIIDGCYAMTSRFEFSPEDIARINAGRPLELTIFGRQHPVIRLSIPEE